MDFSFGQVCTGKTRARSYTNAKVTIPVGLNGEQVYALLDFGCGQILVQRWLTPTTDPTGEQIWLCCIHRNVRTYPSVRVTLTVDGVTQMMTVEVASRLPYSVILGWDLPEFN